METIGVNVQFDESDEDDDEDVYGEEVGREEEEEEDGEEATEDVRIQTNVSTVSTFDFDILVACGLLFACRAPSSGCMRRTSLVGRRRRNEWQE